ncbi:MAG: TlpA family protein disulfide reductase [Myxococcales bacterium]|nr:TlpA family protein disulfide reductase [Myxococcales bacterium]
MASSREIDGYVRWALLLGGLLALGLVVRQHLAASRPSMEAQLVRQLDQVHLAEGPAPDIEVRKADGTLVRLRDLRGKVVFVNFWATWCPPCREELPDLLALREKMKHVDFEILAVSSDASFEDIDRFFGGQVPKMTIGLDPDQRFARIYGTEKLPETYVVDRNGNLRLRFVSVHPWTDEKIHRYLEWLATSG